MESSTNGRSKPGPSAIVVSVVVVVVAGGAVVVRGADVVGSGLSIVIVKTMVFLLSHSSKTSIVTVYEPSARTVVSRANVPV
ncbi:MAG: hypothetical protein ACXACU_00970 [Candidatus Hodarchaeales archaeon]